MNMATLESYVALNRALRDMEAFKDHSFPRGEEDDVNQYAREVAMKAERLSLMLRITSNVPHDTLCRLLKVQFYLTHVVWPKYQYYTLKDDVREKLKMFISRQTKFLEDIDEPQGLGYLRLLKWLVDISHRFGDYANFQDLIAEMMQCLKRSGRKIWSSQDIKEIMRTGLDIESWIHPSSKQDVVELVSEILSLCADRQQILDVGTELRHLDGLNFRYRDFQSNPADALTQIISLSLSRLLVQSTSPTQKRPVSLQVFHPIFDRFAALLTDSPQRQRAQSYPSNEARLRAKISNLEKIIQSKKEVCTFINSPMVSSPHFDIFFKAGQPFNEENASLQASIDQLRERYEEFGSVRVLSAGRVAQLEECEEHSIGSIEGQLEHTTPETATAEEAANDPLVETEEQEPVGFKAI